MVGDGPADRVGLDGEVDRARPDRRQQGARRLADAAPRIRAGRRRRACARLRHQPRALRASSERPARRRPAVHAGLDQLQQAPPVPDLRRHAAPEEGAERRRRRAGQRLVSRRDRVPRHRATTTATPSALLAQIDVTLRGRQARRSSAATASGRRPPGRSCRPRSTRARPTTRASSRPGWSAAGFDDRDWTPVARRRRAARTTSSRRPVRRCAASRRSSRSRS